MPRIYNANGSTTLGANAESQVFTSAGGILHVYLSGTPSTSTITLQVSRKPNTGFVNYIADNVSGTPTTQAFTSSHLAASSTYHRCYLAHGMYYKFVTDNNGSPAWEIEANGQKVTVYIPQV